MEVFDGDAGASARKRIKATGPEIVGGITGTAVGLAVGGPTGAVAGATLAPVVTNLTQWMKDEFAARTLSRREKVRAQAVLVSVIELVKERINNGEKIRYDGFFEEEPFGCEAASEVLEGVILASCRSFEERKIRHLGYLFANVAFTPEVDAALACYAVAMAERLTWRQYLLLAAVERNEISPLQGSDLGDDPGNWVLWGVRRELRELYDQQFVGAPPRRTPLRQLPFPNGRLRDLHLLHAGNLMHGLLSLCRIADAEVSIVRRGLAVSAAGSIVSASDA